MQGFGAPQRPTRCGGNSHAETALPAAKCAVRSEQGFIERGVQLGRITTFLASSALPFQKSEHGPATSCQLNPRRGSPRRCCSSTNPATRWFSTEAVVGLKDPMVGSFGVCCTLAASGHVTAPPSSVMNSRRFMSDLGSPPRSDHPAAGPVQWVLVSVQVIAPHSPRSCRTASIKRNSPYMPARQYDSPPPLVLTARLPLVPM